MDRDTGSDTTGRNGASWASSPGVRRSMQSNRPSDTLPEVRVRSALHREGLRFRKNVRPVPALRCTADVVFPRARVAVFIDGCFWHSCPIHRSMPRTNGEWWRAKLDATKERDRANTRELENAGWSVLRVWEHDEVPAVVALVKDRVATASSQVGKLGRRE
jgi:DNA mismatch endonuclease (patch repair protein)